MVEIELVVVLRGIGIVDVGVVGVVDLVGGGL